MSNKSKDTTADLRSWLGRRLGRDEVPEPLWDFLERDHYVSEVMEDPALKQTLVTRAKYVLRVLKDLGGVTGDGGSSAENKRGKQRRVPSFTEEDPVRQRAEAVSLYWSKMADQDDEVRRFRKWFLGGRTISFEEAQALRDSRAAALLPLEWFKDHEVPLVGHKAQVTRPNGSYAEDAQQSGDQLEIKWADGRLCLPLEDDEQSNPFQLIINSQSVIAEVSRGKKSLITVRGKERPSVITAQVRPEAVLSELEQVALHLTSQFPWEQEEAAWFVLTGEPVQVPPIYEDLSDSDESYPSYIKLTVAPWVPAETVGEVYKARRKELAPVQTTSPKRLAIFRFIMTHPDVKVVDGGRSIEGPSWRSLMEAWNEGPLPDPQWRAEDERNFRRDFKEAFNRLVPSSEQRL